MGAWTGFEKIGDQIKGGCEALVVIINSSHLRLTETKQYAPPSRKQQTHQLACLGLGASAQISLFPNDEVHINARVEVELGDFLDGRRGAVDLNEALVDAHLEAVPGVGTVAARRTACRDGKLLSGNTNGAFHLVHQLLRLLNDLGASILEGLHLSSSQSDANSLHLFDGLLTLHLVFVGVHFQISKANFLINNKQITPIALNTHI